MQSLESQSLESKAQDWLADPRFHRVVHRLASGFVGVQTIAPRLASQFSTQQRWLMCHAALWRFFEAARAGRFGITRQEFVDAVLAYQLASRNTAMAFFAQALQYGLIQPVNRGAGNGAGLVEPAGATLGALIEWYVLHLTALDALDGDNRALRWREAGHPLLSELAPLVAERLLTSEQIRAPAPTYAVFASVDDGGSLMDRLIAGLSADASFDQERAMTNVSSVSSLARPLSLSRTHTGRTLSAAAALGGLGWCGAPGHSAIWLSRTFRLEYAAFQALKLAIIDDAFERTQASTETLGPALPLLGREMAPEALGSQSC
ncbi:hypothetical protein [Bosea sp. NBC_00550]|uniref:hypothetical protein n=1 Tax=Bosea sp. NBC_00550 TaxID=2969621 RepID=UPI002230C526|nr:hypothetical protein [Bosea sp. NBC_00550]UZF93430.1 hypothetical protein NWE53_04275 [Bosea sp. NBC_00550]